MRVVHVQTCGSEIVRSIFTGAKANTTRKSLLYAGKQPTKKQPW